MTAQTLTLLYEGSVKRVLSADESKESLWFEFTDDYSVFDWGKMPDTIANKGRALAIIGAFFFDQLQRKEFWQTLPASKHLRNLDKNWLSERWKHRIFAKLQEQGAPTHFQALKQGSESVTDFSALSAQGQLLMQVERAEVRHPQKHLIGGNEVYFYDNSDLPAKRLVPLEIVFRFGMPLGSSLIERLEGDPHYAKTLGLAETPKPGRLFDRPVIEFFTKLEPKDRLLSYQEAALMSGLEAESFENMLELAYDTALALYVIFAERNIELWDGKVEMICTSDKHALPALKLADSIGPDELRLIFNGCQLSKEMIRQVYRGSAWEIALKKAQAKSKVDPTTPWKDVCLQEVPGGPEKLAPEVKQVVDQLYGVLANHLLDAAIFPDHPELEDFVKHMPSNLVAGTPPSKA